MLFNFQTFDDCPFTFLVLASSQIRWQLWSQSKVCWDLFYYLVYSLFLFSMLLERMHDAQMLGGVFVLFRSCWLIMLFSFLCFLLIFYWHILSVLETGVPKAVLPPQVIRLILLRAVVCAHFWALMDHASSRWACGLSGKFRVMYEWQINLY